jgi:hypothetical protein
MTCRFRCLLPQPRLHARVAYVDMPWNVRALCSYVFEECSRAGLGLVRETIGPIPGWVWEPGVLDPGRTGYLPDPMRYHAAVYCFVGRICIMKLELDGPY